MRSRVVGGVASILFLALLIVFVELGARIDVVLTQSMKPNYNPGDLFVYRVMDISSVKEGDVIVFYDDKTAKGPVIHRVFSIEGEGENTKIKTKGDNMKYSDPWIVTKENFYGFAGPRIPAVGKLILIFGQTGTNRTIGIIVDILLSIIFLFFLFTKKEKNAKRIRRKKAISRDTKRKRIFASCLIGITVLSVFSWYFLYRSISEGEINLQKESEESTVYTATRTVKNRGFIPLAVVTISEENTNEEITVVSPNDWLDMKLQSAKESVNVSSGAFYLTLPREIILALYKVNPYIVPVVIALQIFIAGLIIDLIASFFMAKILPIKKERRRTVNGDKDYYKT